MTDDTKKEIADLKRTVEELKAQVAPKPQPSREDQERATAKWRDEMHQMREGRMAFATPPEVVRDWAILDDNLMKGVREDARVPTGRSGMIPNSQNTGGVVRAPSPTPGYVDPRPLTNPPGTGPGSQADKIVDEFDRRDRAALIEAEARRRLAMKGRG